MAQNLLNEQDEARWSAVQRRDREADDFVYAVSTTGIYCRCGCSSRMPKRENVSFFTSPEAAEAAGYRACLRCRPGQGRLSEAEELVIAACRTIEESETVVGLAQLAEAASLSPHHFHRLFRKIVGVTPKQYASSHQQKRFRKSLRTGHSVSESLYEAGYGSTSRIYEKGRDHLAMSPKTFRAGGRGTTIRFGVAQCFLGWMIVAATDRGICGIEFGDDPEHLTEQLSRHFPEADLVQAGEELSLLIREVVSFIEMPKRGVRLPLDIRGTAFQQKVWNALLQIKPGETASYAEIAEQIGNPSAIRAVARACATNKIGVVIPCHRVIYKNGELSNYRWGIERKRLLLERERAGSESE